MNDAMAQLQEATPCINFRMIPKGQRRPSGDYVHIIKEDGCWSLVGKQGGRQVVINNFNKFSNAQKIYFKLKLIRITWHFYRK